MGVHVGWQALRDSGRDLKAAADELATPGGRMTPQAALLIFYAAECAMKATYVRRHALRDTAQLEHKHDLRRLARDLKLPPGCLPGPCGGKGKSPEITQVHELHEAWRYGRKLMSYDEDDAVRALRAAIAACQERHYQ